MRRRGRGGSPLLGALVVLLSFAIGGYMIFQYSAATQRQKILYLEGLASHLESETVPLRFMVLSRANGEIRARFKLYDLAGGEVAVVEKAWPGAELFVDMLLIPLRSGPKAEAADSWLALPYRIFTDTLSAASGTLLFDAYDSGGFPQVLGGVALSQAERASLVGAFASARARAAAGLPAADPAKGQFGSAVHEVASLSRFEMGIVYKVVCRVKGGIEIMEEH